MWDHLAQRVAGSRGKGWGLRTRPPAPLKVNENRNSMDLARPPSSLLPPFLPASPRGPEDSPVSALSQIPGLRCLQLAEVEAGVEAVGVDRYTLLTPPAPEGMESPGVRSYPGH